MSASEVRPRVRSPEVFERALKARDPRFDGVFFVGITSTGIYCRPVCPARVSHPEHRRFFHTAAAAERSGFRPCLRCRPELAPGRANVDAVPRLADTAARRIAAGGLNGRTVPELAEELSVSARHLRRALRQEIGVSPVELAQTHRLLLAKRLLADTNLTVGRIALASGFQSVRRFNAVFRERYRMAPTDVRRGARNGRRAPDPPTEDVPPTVPAGDLVRLTLSYREPLAWDALVELLRGDTISGVEVVEGRRYGRTLEVDDCRGVVFAEGPEPDRRSRRGPSADGTSSDGRYACGARGGELDLEVSTTLLPALMSALARLRRLFDLDAEPAAVDAHLQQGGIEGLVSRRPGLRLPGAVDGFEVAFKALLRNSARWRAGASDLVDRTCEALGESFESGVPCLDRLTPGPERVAEAGESALRDLGVPRRRAAALVEVARRLRHGDLRLEPGENATMARRRLLEIDGLGDRLATTIVMRALQWPDAFPFSDPALRRAAGAAGRRELRARAERWRPWRAYAALHLWMSEEDGS